MMIIATGRMNRNKRYIVDVDNAYDINNRMVYLLVYIYARNEFCVRLFVFPSSSQPFSVIKIEKIVELNFIYSKKKELIYIQLSIGNA